MTKMGELSKFLSKLNLAISHLSLASKGANFCTSDIKNLILLMQFA